jgi:Right handed beta helix region
MLRRARARWYGVAGLGLIAVALLFGSLGSARSAQALSVLLVDDDGAQCPSAGYTTISDAIAAADSGDTIVVCPGTYDATTVDKRVTLSGYTADLSSKLSKCSDTLNNPADQTTKDSIVAGFYVAADFSTIKGFTVTAPESGINIPWGTDGVWVTRNVLQDNSIGVNLNGTMSLVDHNCIRNNNAGGSASGTGIYSDQGLKSATIANNMFVNNHDGAAITLLDFAALGSLDDVHVKKNTSSGDGDLISIAGSTNSQIQGNTSTGAIGSGIFIEQGTFGPNSLLEISNNTLTNGLDEGINVDDDALVNSTIKNNKTNGNATFGIDVHVGNTDNSIKNNNFKNGGANNDCQDDSSGGGTAGTANTWKNDKGKTASPPGICK